MPLKKSIELDTGVVITHHAVTKLVIEPTEATGFVEIGGYVSKEARDTGRKPVRRTIHHLDLTALSSQGLEDTIKNTLYGWLKTLPEFEGAEDV